MEKELAPHAAEWEETTFADWVFARMGELGFLGLSYPEEYGGQGGDYACNLVLAEEITKSNSGGLAMGIAVHTDMATPPVFVFGTEEQKQHYLVPAIRGEKISCLGITEPDAGSDVAGIKTRAVRRRRRVRDQRLQDLHHERHPRRLHRARDQDRSRHGLRRLHALPGRHGRAGRDPREGLEKLGMHASDTALLAFQDVRVPRDAVLGQEGKGFYHIMWELQGERLIGAAGCVAGAQRCFDRTLQYALERNAFGRQIGKFQVIRHKFAEMATKIESARQLTYTTAWRFQNGEYPVREISMAKLYASRIAVEVADECIQIHGGAGYMKEYGVERVWRDMRLNRIGAGTDEIMLDVIGRSYGL